MPRLRLVLGDQLNENHSWFSQPADTAEYLIVELRQETDYVLHHVQKVCGYFLAMREFAGRLSKRGFRVHYVPITDEKAHWDLQRLVVHFCDLTGAESFEYQEPDEYRLDLQLKAIADDLSISSSACSTEHFLSERGELTDLFRGKKRLLMETFYRHMRKRYHILMEGEQPEGGKWNYDQQNRKKWKGDPPVPAFPSFTRPLHNLLKEMDEAGVKTFGEVPEKGLDLPLNRDEAVVWLDHFCQQLLPWFGDYQDAFAGGEPYLFHSRISFALNLKILSPLEVIDAVLKAYRERSGEIHISQVEGFVRQILGWREFVRGLYWKEMPDYKELNALENHRPLPEFFWTGKTRMNCMKQSIGQSLELAYAHHIQRLMIIGNFALLYGCKPSEVDAWYLGVYVDAIEWVQLPNTHGMSQWADGGIMATKPYVSSANYISKMGDYCKGCSYKPQQKLGEDACPFNALYWNFLSIHENKLRKNPRMSMMYNLLNKLDPNERAEMEAQAGRYFASPESL